MIMTGDFNQWDTLWSNNEITNHLRQDEEKSLINLIAEYNLQLLIPQGKVTYQGREQNNLNYFIMDLVFVSD